MKEEIIELTENASNLINDFENYMYENAKEKYIGAKAILDKNKEKIELINETIDDIDLENTKTDLEAIINSIKEAQEELNNNTTDEEELINNAAPKEDENIFKEDTIDSTIEALNNGLESIEEEPAIEEEMVEKASEDIDTAAIDAFLANNDFNVEEPVIENEEASEEVESTPSIEDDTTTINFDNVVDNESLENVFDFDDLDTSALDAYLNDEE